MLSTKRSRPCLSWALIVPTYERKDVLIRSLRLAARQTRPPGEIIVIDSSHDAKDTKSAIMKELALTFSHIRWEYLSIEKPSTTAQRNRGVRSSSSDICFLFDDDTLMYSDCAENIMEIYEADQQEDIAGIGATLKQNPPKEVEECGDRSTDIGQVPRNSWAARLFQKALAGNRYLLPYDTNKKPRAIPKSVKNMQTVVVDSLRGATMSFRRKFLLREPFDEMLERYAYLEDADVSQRVSRHGILLRSLDAHACHLEVSSARISEYASAVLAGMNAMALHRIHGTNPMRFRYRYQENMIRRSILMLLKDIRWQRWSIPRTRGTWYAITSSKKIFSKSTKELREWYPYFQRNLIDSNTR